ncbi:MAG TPA: hypothetical protein VF438_01345 [Candidatus Paceibacterota bacterium]
MLDLIEKHFPNFTKRHGLEWTLLSFVVVTAIAVYGFLNEFSISPLKEENTKLTQQLLPFKTIAFEKFFNNNLSSSSADAALGSLAERVGQLELTTMSMFDYQEVSTWTFLGDTVKHLASVGSSGSTVVSGWTINNIRLNNEGQITGIQCNNSAVSTYVSTIQKAELYPFAYYILGLCQQQKGDPSWQVNMGKAYKILSQTTKIPGHNPDHDVVLRLIVEAKPPKN